MRENFEIINNGQVTPHRLHALVKLVARLNKSHRQEIIDLLQPASLSNNQKAAKAVYRTALRCELIEESEEDETVALHSSISSPTEFQTKFGFREIMQQRILGISDPDKDNYLLNLFAAWYTVQGSEVLRTRKKDIHIQFNGDLFPADDGSSIESGRAFNPTKFNAWKTWAVFLGWGWEYKDTIMPASYVRIRPIIRKIKRQSMPFSSFMHELSQACPELDGGSLYNYCWDASRPALSRGQNVSLMLSTGLRVLNQLQDIRLYRQADATDLWQLHPAEGHPIQEVSHIQIL
jgi:hypothetical protein